MSLEDAFAGLNDEQVSVVAACSEPLLVMACVGSGKTRALAHRAAQAIAQGHSPDEMLIVTFTNKAANEMRDRVMALVPQMTPRHVLRAASSKRGRTKCARAAATPAAHEP